ncbi:MAG TPA: hypothetical protein DDW17_03960 [Deltaproteobacteria bacterium]|nr:hypothetical protein [Deltaproteobacteria bacterium]
MGRSRIDWSFELRLNNITGILDATRYLNEVFIPKYCRLFGVEPEDPTPAWRNIPSTMDIRTILCKRYERKVSNDNTVSVNGQIIQLLPTKTRRHFVRTSVSVNRWLDGSWHVFHPDHGEIPCIPCKGVRPVRTLRPVSWQRNTARVHLGDDIFNLQKG